MLVLFMGASVCSNSLDPLSLQREQLLETKEQRLERMKRKRALNMILDSAMRNPGKIVLYVVIQLMIYILFNMSFDLLSIMYPYDKYEKEEEQNNTYRKFMMRVLPIYCIVHSTQWIRPIIDEAFTDSLIRDFFKKNKYGNIPYKLLNKKINVYKENAHKIDIPMNLAETVAEYIQNIISIIMRDFLPILGDMFFTYFRDSISRKWNTDLYSDKAKSEDKPSGVAVNKIQKFMDALKKNMALVDICVTVIIFLFCSLFKNKIKYSTSEGWAWTLSNCINSIGMVQGEAMQKKEADIIMNKYFELMDINIWNSFLNRFSQNLQRILLLVYFLIRLGLAPGELKLNSKKRDVFDAARKNFELLNNLTNAYYTVFSVTRNLPRIIKMLETLKSGQDLPKVDEGEVFKPKEGEIIIKLSGFNFPTNKAE